MRTSMDSPTLKDIVRDETQGIRDKIAEKLAAIRDAVAVFLGATIAPQLPKASLVVALIAVGAGYFVALNGMLNVVTIVLPIALVGLALGLVSAQDIISRAGMILSIVAVLEGIGFAIYFQRDSQLRANQMQHDDMEHIREVGKKKEAELKAAFELQAKQEAAALAKKNEEIAAKKAEEERQTQDFLKKQQAVLDQAKAQEDKRKAEELAVKQKADEAARIKKAEDLKQQASLINKSDAIEKAKEDYRTLTVKVDELNDTVGKLEETLKVAKEEFDRKAVFLERRNSPNPPSEEDLTKAQAQYDKWKVDLDRLKLELPKSKAELDKATKEKQQAGALLDSLQK